MTPSTQQLTVQGLTIDLFAAPNATADIMYMLTPIPGLESYFATQPSHVDSHIAVISGMDWDNDLTPWPAPGQPPGCPDFKGLAPDFLNRLRYAVIPAVEHQLGITDARRTLLGISLSGLFALWQWIECDVFESIASISGSFWYEGFDTWLSQQAINHSGARAYFSLGNLEPQSRVKAFRCVGSRTEQVLSLLRKAGVDATFQWTQGTHFAPPQPRLDDVMQWYAARHP